MKPIKFEDIQKGDTIQRTEKGLIITGVAYEQTCGKAYWLSTKEGVVAEAGSHHLLIDRPMPPLPTEPGTVFRATNIRGLKTSVIMFVRYGSLLGTPIYVSANRVHGYAEHAPEHITAWEPIEVNNA